MRRRLALVLACALGGCAADVRDIGRAPHFTAIGSGLAADAQLPPTFDARPSSPPHTYSMWNERGGDLFKDARAASVGDLITIVISIDDKASIGNATSRERDATFTNAFDAAITSPYASGKGSASADANTRSISKGTGTIDRSEKIQLSVAAVVTEVLPNGNLMISGSQEVRVNFELRELTVAGIVRPRDVSRDNTIGYDKIAEARISYGGRGRITEVQQPALVHQVIDLLKPF
ncbi:MAG: flagellar basal body L-ring protein FlgH [Hyphomicrobiales bacterium]|nr:flagellar basal body L-ring protein FlgH [Hyphomicrobiales bacterium]